MADLALLGGPRAVSVPCPSPTPVDADRALDFVRVWLSGKHGSSLSGQGATAYLEERFRSLTGRRYAVAVSSGTAGLLVSLRAAAVGQDDAVLVSSYDWPAAAAAVLSLGARPVPIDVDLATGTLSAASLAERTTGQERAMVVTHLAGRPAEMEPLIDFARQRGIALIEDCAQALGATYRGHSVGSFGDFGVFSLGPRKLVDAGEGGVVAMDDERLYEAALRLSQHPIYQRLRGVEPDRLHLNFRIHPCASALALPQLEDLALRLKRIRANGHRWSQLFQSSPGFIAPKMPPGANPAWRTCAIRYDATAWGAPIELALAALQAEGIPIAPSPVASTICSLIRRSVHTEDRCCPGAEEWRVTALELPCPDADPVEFGDFVETVSSAVGKVWQQRGRLRSLAH